MKVELTRNDLVDLITLRDNVTKDYYAARAQANLNAVCKPGVGLPHFGERVIETDRLRRTLNGIIEQTKI